MHSMLYCFRRPLVAEAYTLAQCADEYVVWG